MQRPVSVVFRRASPTDPWPLGGHLLAFGHPRDVDATPAASASARTVDLPDAVLLPGLVNAHTHLDLTHIGPVEHRPEDGFVRFVDVVRRGRRHDAAGVRDAVRLGIARAIAGGTVAVGDILGAVRPDSIQPHAEAIDELRRSPLSGVAFIEFFALAPPSMGPGDDARATPRDAATSTHPDAAITAMGSPTLTTAQRMLRRWLDDGGAMGVAASERWRVGLQPHAPYSVHRAGYRHAATLARRWGVPVATHLAESPEEHEFVARARGPQREMLETLGVWNEGLLAEFGHHRTPVAQFALAWMPGSSGADPPPPPVLVAHVNDATDDDLELLAACNATVVYCPRSSSYFGAEHAFGPHRYRDMLARGINVCLGTDSIVNLPLPVARRHDRRRPASASVQKPGRGRIDPENLPALSVLDEMRLLARRDAGSPIDLLAMGTVRGARALGLDEHAFTFPVSIAGSKPTRSRAFWADPSGQHPYPIGGLLAVPIDRSADHPVGARAGADALSPASLALRSDAAPTFL